MSRIRDTDTPQIAKQYADFDLKIIITDNKQWRVFVNVIIY